ncbi:HpcH/HpaI aldolase/citrate lyase family protein [Spirillospora sp. NPDC048819]|uniref:HpcH/HpaI aldolase family protein n=1 Tax=Spirillospora sp. NPDC048819 TaxID=3155268 RepID=UPI003405F157
MEASANTFLHSIGSGRAQIGIWANLTDPVTAEICAGAGFDWMLIDGEHAPNDVRTILALLQAVQPYPTAPIVRPAIGDPALLKQLLDIGARTLLVPMVDTVDQAEAIARAVCYPPVGVRGVAGQTRAGRWGRREHYLENARDEICLIVQIETVTGLANADAIAAVDGIDAVFVGPADLAASLGHLGRPAHPDVQDAVRRVREAAEGARKPVGILTLDEELAHRYLDGGFSFVGVGIDTHQLVNALSGLRGRF